MPSMSVWSTKNYVNIIIDYGLKLLFFNKDVQSRK